jgi:hypothetical protein
MTAPTLAADAAADARFQEEIAAQYRDYLAYLDAKLTLLDVQAARTSVAFERAEAREDDEQAARNTIAAIPAQRRALFDAVVEQERQEAQRQLEAQVRETSDRPRRADPDEAAYIALTRLRDEANGIGTEGGKGLLPYGKPDGIKWYAVDGAALRAAPTAAAYSAHSLDAKTRKRMVWQVGGALAVILLSLIWLLVPKGSPRLAVTLPHVATANGAALTAWPIQALVLTLTRGDTSTMPVSATTALTWPGDAATTQAYWRSTTVWPLRLCVPRELLADIASVQLLGSGTTPARTYTLLAAPTAAADLILESCQGGMNAPPPRRAVLRETIILPILAIGEAAALPDGPLALTAITLTGPGQDPTLPSDQARVRVRVQTSLKPDWPLFAPTLLLPSGVAALPSDITTTDGGAELSYLLPLPSEPLEVAWSITPRADTPALRWRATLEPPPSRAAVLRDALEVKEVQAAPGETPGTVVATIIVANRGKAPLQLTSADLTLIANTRVLATPDLAALRQPLDPGEQRTLTITAPLGEREMLTLSVGVARFAIEPIQRR